jgi:hypothetical protein
VRPRKAQAAIEEDWRVIDSQEQLPIGILENRFDKKQHETKKTAEVSFLPAFEIAV